MKTIKTTHTVPHNHTDTSIEAAKKMANVAPSIEEHVHRFIKSQEEHGATNDEIELRLNLKKVSPRTRGLVKRFLVVNSGMKRKTRSGTNAIVWVDAKYSPGPIQIKTTREDVIRSLIKSAVQSVKTEKDLKKIYDWMKLNHFIDPPYSDLKKLRLAKGLSQQQAADIIGIEQWKFSTLERSPLSEGYWEAIEKLT